MPRYMALRRMLSRGSGVQNRAEEPLSLSISSRSSDTTNSTESNSLTTNNSYTSSPEVVRSPIPVSGSLGPAVSAIFAAALQAQEQR
jgi:hypothetical protein